MPLELELQPIIYGPTIPDPNTLGICICLGARVKKSGDAQGVYNWVQRVSASDKTKAIENVENARVDAATKEICVYPQDERPYFGESSYFIDNCEPLASKPGFPDPSNASFREHSELYRNGNARLFTGVLNPTWVDLKDLRPFDYLFFDIPSRTISDIDNQNAGKSPTQAACGESDATSSIPAFLSGLSRLKGARTFRWCAVLTPVGG